jgi:hypothetical protein
MATETAADTKTPSEKKGTRREIPGDIPYTPTHGRLSEALKALIDAERPPKFNESFLESYMRISGGTARAIPPILKRTGFLNSDNSPTERYSRFKSDSSRSRAALEGLRQGFSEIFKRNEYAHKLSDDKIRDIIVEITGLNKNDNIVGYMLGTFNAFRQHVKDSVDEPKGTEKAPPTAATQTGQQPSRNVGNREFTLVNQISVVLPETTDVQVYNAIFESIRKNLLE